MSILNQTTFATLVTNTNTAGNPPAGAPSVVQASDIAIVTLVYGPNAAPGLAAVVLPAWVAPGNELELLGDYTNPQTISFYPASGDTVANATGVGGNVGPGGVRVLKKMTSTDWRVISSVG